jgi:hypothetical protein
MNGRNRAYAVNARSFNNRIKLSNRLTENVEPLNFPKMGIANYEPRKLLMKQQKQRVQNAIARGIQEAEAKAEAAAEKNEVETLMKNISNNPNVELNQELFYTLPLPIRKLYWTRKPLTLKNRLLSKNNGTRPWVLKKGKQFL